MKTNKMVLATLLSEAPLLGFYLEWDDIYANPLAQ